MILNMFLAGASSTAMVVLLAAGPAEAQTALVMSADGAVGTLQLGAGQGGAAQSAQPQSTTPFKADAKKRKKRREDAKANTQSQASDTSVAAKTQDQTKTDSDIVVNGVRTAMADARTEKLESDAIVNAEDIGKLPNNTIGDVIASIPGIAVERSEGEVNNIQLRGLNNVQTTIGGTPFESGAGRVASIADLPADLVKSVEVYKTRTPDQVEGAGAGTVNIEFRKPTDFKRTLTIAGNVTGRYNNQSRRINQVYTGIVNYRRDTSIGVLGAQFGFTLNYNPFLESRAQNQILGNVQSRQVVGPQILPYPTYAPTEALFEYTTGSRTTPTFNGALQWSANGESVVLEGTYAKPTFDKYTNTLYLPITIQGGSTNTLPALSNIVLVPGTNRMASVTVMPVTQIGPISYNGTSRDSNFLYKLSGRHDEDLFSAYAEIAYTGGDVDYQQVEFRNRFINRPTIDIKFAGTDFGFPMMQANFSGVDLLDPKQ